MKKYKLKKEARQFFSSEYGRFIEPLEFWIKNTISLALLEEGERVRVEIGKIMGEDTKYIKGWSGNNGKPNAYFEFTVYVDDINTKDYEAIKIPEVIDEIQEVLNQYFKY